MNLHEFRSDDGDKKSLEKLLRYTSSDTVPFCGGSFGVGPGSGFCSGVVTSTSSFVTLDSGLGTTIASDFGTGVSVS